MGAQLGDIAIQSPRLAIGDVTGDGFPDLVVGGRIGRFRAVTDPLSARRARVTVNPGGESGFGPPQTFDGLHVVDDVVVADVDGDSVSEIVVTGAGRLVLLRLRLGRWSAHETSLPGEHTHRLAQGDLDGDGRPEILVAMYGVHDLEEQGHTEILPFRWSAGKMIPGMGLEVEGHVGDMALTRSVDEAFLIVESGHGDEGGLLSVYGVSQPGEWRLVSTSHLKTSARVTSISTRVDRPNELLVGSIDGGIYAVSFPGLQPIELAKSSSGLSDLAVGSFGGDTILIAGSPGGLQTLGFPSF
jgi:hypothetical protein